MRNRRIASVVLVALCLGLGASVAVAEEGWKLKMKSRDEQGVESMIDILIGAEHLKAREVGSDDEVILGPQGVTAIQHRGKTYMSMTFEQMKSMMQAAEAAGAMGSVVADAMKQALEKMPEADRARAEAYMKKVGTPGAAPAPAAAEDAHYEIRGPEGTQTIAGLSAKKYVVTKDGKPAAVAWLAEGIAVDAIVDTIVRLAELAPKKLMDSAGSNLDLYRHLTGFPARLEDLETGQVFEMVEAQHATFGPDTWKAPQDYKPGMGMP